MDENESSQDEFATLGDQPPAEPDLESKIPEKYRGKTPDELLKIVMDQEKFIGRQAEEVGFARKMAEEITRTRQSAQPAKAPPQEDDLDEADFFSNPKEAINKAVERHPEVQKAKQLASELRQEAMTREVKSRHSDVDAIVSDPSFGAWVQGNKARVKLLQEAHFNFDADAADELLTNYKLQRKLASAETEEKTEQIKAKQATNLKAAQVDAGTRNTSGGRIYRRADVQEVMKDPVKYAAYADEIFQAYAEGRVR
jgi:hypothetical protein